MKKTIVISALALSATALQADTLHLRDGSTISGVFISGTRTELHFQPDGRPVDRFSMREVESVSFEGNSDSSIGRAGNYNTGNAGYDGNRPEDRNRDDNGRYPDPSLDPNSGRARDNGGYRDQNGEWRPSSSRNQGDYRGGAPGPYRSSPSGRVSAPSDYLLPAGTVISVRTIDPIDSEQSRPGDTLHASLDRPIIVNGRTLAPAGSDAELRIVQIQEGGRISGNGDLSLSLSGFQANGTHYVINSNNEEVSSNGNRGRQSAEVIGGTAALGAIIGAIAGGGKGAAIGAGAGAATGTGVQVIRGRRIRIPAETRLNFTLNQDVAL